MSSQTLASAFLAWRDWKFEYLISICAVLALASMLAPILVLQGLKNGVIESMRSRLLEDPTILIITPKSDGGGYSPANIQELARLPGASYAIGRTRETATDITLYKNDRRGGGVSIALEPASPGEPVLGRYRLDSPKNTKIPEIVLSATAASALKVKPGETLTANLARKTPEGRLESVKMPFLVSGILPIEAADRKMAFVSVDLLRDMQNYRDYLEVPERGFSGNPASGEISYSSFRLYAKDLDSVESLAKSMEDRKIEVVTRAREIAGIRMLENAVNQVILIISIAVGAGFVAFTISSAQSAVSRKKRMLGMLRLLGFNRAPMMLYPTIQCLLTAICGFGLSLVFYLAVSMGLEHAFSSQKGFTCSLSPENIIFALLTVLALSAFASLRGSYAAAGIEPSTVIREV